MTFARRRTPAVWLSPPLSLPSPPRSSRTRIPEERGSLARDETGGGEDSSSHPPSVLLANPESISLFDKERIQDVYFSFPMPQHPFPMGIAEDCPGRAPRQRFDSRLHGGIHTRLRILMKNGERRLRLRERKESAPLSLSLSLSLSLLRYLRSV